MATVTAIDQEPLLAASRPEAKAKTCLRNVNGRYSSSFAGHIARPTSVSEVQKLVRETTGSIKTLGGQYTVGSSALPSSSAGERASGDRGMGLVLDMSGMSRVHEPRDGTVQVEAGATMRQLLDRLKGTGLQPGVVPVYGNFSIGGISSTPFYDISIANGGCHSEFSTDVVEYRLVLADGSLMIVDGNGSSNDMLYFLRTHQGLLGIVYQVTLRLYPVQPHRVRFKAEHISAISEDSATSGCGGGNYEYLYVYPGCGDFIKEQHSRTNWEKPTGPAREVGDGGAAGGRERTGTFLQIYQRFFKVWDTLCHYLVPIKAVPRFQLGLQQLYVASTALLGDQELSPYDRGQLGPKKRHISLSDWHFSPSAFPAALMTAKTLCERFRADHGVTASFISVYFLPENGAGAGYTSKGGAKYAIDLVSYFPTSAAQVRLEQEWSRVARDLGGAPAINKNPDFSFGPSDMRRIFGEQDYERFRGLCRQFDPAGRFCNARLAELFDLHGAAQ